MGLLQGDHLVEGGTQGRPRPLVGRALLQRDEDTVPALEKALEQELVLAGEVPEEAAVRHPGRLGDLVHGRRLEPLLGEQLSRRDVPPRP